uniref:type III secretion system inner rod subunit SctI n=1 Tax=Pandoraea pnomenusa TaxID=93220 RepID=UPI0003C73C61|nr:type III secretion system inner rod subunit SctI [Pandoraea pnomenusa]
MLPPNVSLSTMLEPSTLTDATPQVVSAATGIGESLESRFFNAVAQMSAEFEGDRQRIAYAVRGVDATDPKSMIELQTKLADYSLQVAMVSTLARKSVGAVEALLR